MFFLHVFMCLVLFGVVRLTELYLTSSVLFGQNVKTQLRSVTTLWTVNDVTGKDPLVIIDGP
jgi:hypothetical protein